MKPLAIKASGLSRSFGAFQAIQSLDLAVEKGSIYGFLGPNGCGKTTTIRLLTGLLSPTSGSVEVLGLTLPEQAEELRTKMGYMTQKFSLFDDLTVRENLKFLADIYSLPRKQQASRIDELLITYKLTDKADNFAGSMSGGQRQRLALAGAVIHQPELLFLDEPTSAVDPENRRQFWQQLFDLSDAGTTILVSSHYMDEAERCHKLAILENGIKRADDAPAKLMANIKAHVVEVTADELRQIKSDVALLPDVISAAQLGAHLRVLVKKEIDDPIAYLRQQLTLSENVELEIVRPSLEDVFVTCTGKSRQ